MAAVDTYEYCHDGRPNVSTIIASILMVVTILFVVARTASRRIAGHTIDWSDHLLHAGMMGAVGFNIGMIAAAKIGSGIHQSCLPHHKVVILFILNFSGEFNYIFAITNVKLSILLLYKSIFITRRLHIIINCVAGIVLLWAVGFFINQFFLCKPISDNWNHFELCRDPLKPYIANAVSNTLIDITILTIPALGVWNMRLSKKQKFHIVLSFGLGSMVITASVCRLVAIFHVPSDTVPGFKYGDATYTYEPLAQWTEVEMNMAVISACLPVLRPLLFLLESRIRPNHAKSKMSHSSYSWPSSNHNKRPRIRQHDVLSESEEAVMTTLAISTLNTRTLVEATTGPEEDVEMGGWKRKDPKGRIKAETEISTFWSNDVAALTSIRSPSTDRRLEDDEHILGTHAV